MHSSSNNKSNFLGLPHGTAVNRLRKMVLFDILKRHNEAICFRCGAEIMNAGQLSLEHKLPWEGVSVELFWDISNIAFSHLTCNKPHRNIGRFPRKIGKENEAWCSFCQVFKDKSLFDKQPGHWNGLNRICRECFNYKRRIRRASGGKN